VPRLIDSAAAPGLLRAFQDAEEPNEVRKAACTQSRVYWKSGWGEAASRPHCPRGTRSATRQPRRSPGWRMLLRFRSPHPHHGRDSIARDLFARQW